METLDIRMSPAGLSAANIFPYETLRKIWLDTTQAQPGCDSPQTEEMLRTIRTVNTSLPRERHVRVLLGDPPIRWEDIKTKADHRKWIERRETFPATVVQREVLAKGRKALLIYGVGHLWRKNPHANFDSTGVAASLVSLLEETPGVTVFNVGLTLDLDKERSEVAFWPAPSLAVLRGTDLGAAPVPYDGPRISIQDGQIVPVPRDQWRSIRMEDQYAALLYIGPRTSWSYTTVSPALCADSEYVEMRSGRMALVEWKTDTTAGMSEQNEVRSPEAACRTLSTSETVTPAEGKAGPWVIRGAVAA